MENKIAAVIFDTETTGFVEPALIEAAGIIIKGNPLEEQKTTFISRYNPGKPISFGAMATHNILDCDVKDCPPASEFRLPDNTAYIVGHNIDYDWQVIGKPDIKRIDTLAMARAVYPDLDSHNLSALSYALAEPDKRPQIREILLDRHNALTDAELCLDILRRILKEKPGLVSWGSIWRFSEESRIPKTMPFGKHKGVLIKDIPDDYKEWLKKQSDIDEYLLKALDA
ncbi:MAG: putative quorum-sensing-regulated virulence factor [bacterium]